MWRATRSDIVILFTVYDDDDSGARLIEYSALEMAEGNAYDDDGNRALYVLIIIALQRVTANV